MRTAGIGSTIPAVDFPSDIPVLMRHDRGCKYAREDNGGHSDAARRLSEEFNLRKLVGEPDGWIAASLADGSTDGEVYESRADAVNHQHHNERNRAYINLRPPHMSVCEAAAVLAWNRQAANLAPAQRGEAGGGLVVIPRLDVAGQLAAMAGGGLPIALGRKR